MREQQAFTYDTKNQPSSHVPLRAHRPEQQVLTTTPPTNGHKRQQRTFDDSAFRIPASQLRHRPIGNLYEIPLTDGTVMRVTERELEDLPEEYQDAAQLVTPHLPSGTPTQRRQPHPKVPIQDDTVYEMPSARQSDTDVSKAYRKRRRIKHPLLYLGVGMLAMLALWVLGSMVVTGISTKLDDMTYGYPRTFQTNAVVGHNGDSAASPSHFIFLNLNRHVEVIEIPAGDPTKMRVYIVTTLFGDNDDLTPITGYFKDVNHDGKPDMIIKIQDSRIVFLNENGAFRALKPGEQVNL